MQHNATQFAARINERRIINGREQGDGDFNPFILNPIKYQYAMDAYQKGNRNHWLPEEIGMAADIAQWDDPKAMTDDERRVVKIALGYFTTADSIVANNLVLAIYRHLTAPECRMYLLRQAFEEAVHTNAYQYIVESLGLDEDEIFGMYRNSAAIWEKDKFSVGQFDALLDPAFATGTPAADRLFLENLINFYLITEGMFFYSAFAAMFSFRRRNLLPGTAEQFQYIMRDESMHMNFGIDTINHIKREAPQLWDAAFEQKVIDKVRKAAALEGAFARHMMPRGILGLNAESFEQYVRYVADQRLAAISIRAVSGVRNPFPWMAEAVDIGKQKNFFETRVTDYQTGGALEFDDDF